MPEKREKYKIAGFTIKLYFREKRKGTQVSAEYIKSTNKYSRTKGKRNVLESAKKLHV